MKLQKKSQKQKRYYNRGAIDINVTVNLCTCFRRVLMDHKFNWFRYSWFLSAFFFTALLSSMVAHTWPWENRKNYDEHMASPPVWPFVWTQRFDDSPKLCPLCHHRASIIIRLLVVFVAWSPPRVKVNSSALPDREGYKINPSSRPGTESSNAPPPPLQQLCCEIEHSSMMRNFNSTKFCVLRRRQRAGSLPKRVSHFDITLHAFVMVSWSFPSTSSVASLRFIQCFFFLQVARVSSGVERNNKSYIIFREYEIRRRASALGSSCCPCLVGHGNF